MSASTLYIIRVRLRVSRSTVLLILSFTALFIILFTYKADINNNIINKPVVIKNLRLHKSMVDEFYSRRTFWNTSKLGGVLFKNQRYPNISEHKLNNTFVILIWKYWEFLQKRHVFYFGNTRHDPLEGCSVSNCIFTGDDATLQSADAVVVHLHRGELPQVAARNRSQRWIFLNDEAPPNAFSQAKHGMTYEELDNVFNWSMTFQSRSDIPVPYGRTVPLLTPKFPYKELSLAKLVPNWNDKDRSTLVAILISNCGVSYRMNLINSLKEYIDIDVHGKCGDRLKKSCPGGFRSDCKELSKYLFYLVLENSLCDEYMTEKLFYNAYHYGAIPIIQGPSVKECDTFLPPNSYLHVDNYETLKDLADDVIRISKDEEELLSYHWWRNHFEAANEHGYFKSKSFHLCRVCEAMNYNDDVESVYSLSDLKRFFDTNTLCREPNIR